jgi:hypothetical protein
MKFLIQILFFVSFIFVSCSKDTLSDSFKIGLENEFQYGEINQSDDNSLKFSITEINDSRCPSDVVCIWEGEAIVKIKIESPQKATINLSTYDNLIDTLANYSFELIDVSPYPISTKTIKLNDYTVTLKIEEL